MVGPTRCRPPSAGGTPWRCAPWPCTPARSTPPCCTCKSRNNCGGPACPRMPPHARARTRRQHTLVKQALLPSRTHLLAHHLQARAAARLRPQVGQRRVGRHAGDVGRREGAVAARVVGQGHSLRAGAQAGNQCTVLGYRSRRLCAVNEGRNTCGRPMPTRIRYRHRVDETELVLVLY